MRKKVITYIFCLDDNRHFCDDLRKTFSDPAKYIFFSSSSPADIIKEFASVGKRGYCKIVVMAINESAEHLADVESLTRDLKSTDQFTGLILVHPSEKSDDIRKSIVFNIDAYIQRNGSTISRIHNSVCKLISEYKLRMARKRFKTALILFAAFLILSGILLLLYLISDHSLK